jgi:hypothetical protein
MDYARHQAEMMRPGPDGVPNAEHWSEAARRGNAVARAKLDGPPFPDALGYLWQWAMELQGRSGVGMAGLNPLSYGTIMDWATLTDQYPEPHEIEALLILDAVMRAPEPKDQGRAVDEPAPPDTPWPTRKPEAERD